MKAELKAKIDEIAQAILSNPDMMELPHRDYAQSRTFRYVPTSRTTYHGTYLNPFSLPHEGDPIDKPLLWSDVMAQEQAEIVLEPLHRRNGAPADVNVRLLVYHTHSDIREEAELRCWPHETTIHMRRLIAEQSPTDYWDKRQFVNTFSHLAYKAKVSGKAKSKAIQNVLVKAMAVVKEFVPRDHSAKELRREDYHASTEGEHDAWIAARRKAGKPA